MLHMWTVYVTDGAAVESAGGGYNDGCKYRVS